MNLSVGRGRGQTNPGASGALNQAHNLKKTEERARMWEIHPACSPGLGQGPVQGGSSLSSLQITPIFEFPVFIFNAKYTACGLMLRIVGNPSNPQDKLLINTW